MLLEQISVHRFRNLKTQQIFFPSRVTIISGRNGQGKTSLLEAIALLCHTRSFRTSTNRELVSWEEAPVSERGATVEATLRTAEGTKKISYRLHNGKREIFINEKPIESARSFYGNVRAVEFTPEDLSLVRGEPQERRRFLDRTLAMVDGSFVEDLVHFQRALRSRNSLLKQLHKTQTNQSDSAFDKTFTSQVVVFDQILVERGRRLVAARAEFVRTFAPIVARYYAEIAGDSSENIELELESTFLNDRGELISADELRDQYRETHRSDLDRGRTKLGPHRDELAISITIDSTRKLARNVASQGQTRTIALALKLAAVEYLSDRSGEPPLVLLDDVESELDASRRGALLKLIQSAKNQIIITTTDPKNIASELPAELDLKTISKGLIEVENA